MRAILVTGCAGFIGFHVSRRLLADGEQVVGLDNLNPYYDPKLKQARLDQLIPRAGFTFVTADVAGRAAMESLFGEHRFDCVVHLAAQAGVRYSLKDPHAYVNSNLVGFVNILEGCRHSGVGHLVFASSSSVYGANTHMPFSVHDGTDHPVSLYAATKKANEMMAHSYAHLYRLPATGLRFFTVYGPWGRPDMALFLFTRAILEGKPIDVYNFGKMRRDFTFIDDIVEGVVRVMNHVPQADAAWNSERPDPASSSAPYRIYNIGNTRPADLMVLIEAVEKKLGKKAQKNLLPIEPGDVPATWSDVEDLTRHTGFTPRTSIEEGVNRFVDWYREYYHV
ncbi:MAG: NAD-dependent epimerase [Terriglobia bacterium]